MKKVLYIFFSFILFASCSSKESSDIEEMDINVIPNINEIRSELGLYDVHNSSYIILTDKGALYVNFDDEKVYAGNNKDIVNKIAKEYDVAISGEEDFDAKRVVRIALAAAVPFYVIIARYGFFSTENLICAVLLVAGYIPASIYAVYKVW